MAVRTATGFITGTLYIWLCLHGFYWALGTLALVCCLCLYEYARLIPGLQADGRMAFIALGTGCMAALALALGRSADLALGALMLVLTMIAFSALAVSAMARGEDAEAAWQVPRALLLICVPLAFVPVVCDYPGGPAYFALLMGASFAADTGAIWTGKLIGRTPLIPAVSPGKTLEGLIGGALSAGAVWAGVPLILAPEALPLAGQLAALERWQAVALLFALGALVSLAGVLGDLTISLVKRQLGIKDFGRLLPGHGGMLDRFDSVLFTAPIIYLLARL